MELTVCLVVWIWIAFDRSAELAPKPAWSTPQNPKEPSFKAPSRGVSDGIVLPKSQPETGR